MRKILLLLFLFYCLLTSLSATTTDNSKKAIKLQAGKYQIQQLFENISKQSGLIFSYNPKIVDINQSLLIKKSTTAPVSTILKQFLPTNIRIKFVDKYIILMKRSPAVIEVQTKTPLKPVAPVLSTDTLTLFREIKTEPIVVPDSTIDPPQPVAEPFLISPDTLDKSVEIFPPDTVRKTMTTLSFRDGKANAGIAELELSLDFRQFSVSVHAGIPGLYAIVSMGVGAEKVRSAGLGVGTGVKFGKNLGVNLEFIRYGLVSGQTYNLGVRNNISHFRPEVNYTISPDFILFAGPTFSIINSKYVSSEMSFDLGSKFSYGAAIGFKINFFPLFIPKMEGSSVR